MSSDTNPLDLHADTFITDTPIFIDSQLTVSHPLEEVSPTKFELNELPETVIVSKVESEEANPKDSSKIKSPLKSISTAAASALPKVDRMINGSNRHYKTLASNTSEDDERLLQGMSSEAAAYDFKKVSDFSHGTSRLFATEDSCAASAAGGVGGTAAHCDVNGGSAEDEADQGGAFGGGYSYGDFHTIDWVRDIQRDRSRHRQLIKRCNAAGNTWKCTVLRYYDSLNAWICVFLVGCLAGSVASIIDIGAQWMTDLKYGLCGGQSSSTHSPSSAAGVSNGSGGGGGGGGPQLWFNREQCCWASEGDSYSLDDCDEWLTWSELIAGTNSGFGASVILFVVFIWIALLFAGLGATLVRVFAPYACGSGIPEIKTILSGFIIKGYLGFWTLLIKTTTMMLSVSAGLSLGKEGPLVHIATCCGNLFVRFFPKYGQNEAKKREIMSASCAAGVAVAFGAPMGGILFSLEEASYYFPMKTLYRSFFCALVATSVLSFINPLGTDHAVLFYVEYNTPWYMFELCPCIVLGVFGGFCGALFIRSNIEWCRYRKRSVLGKYPITEVFVVTGVTALLSYFNEYTWMPTNQLIYQLFKDCSKTDSTDLCDYNSPVSSSPEDSANVTGGNSHQYPYASAGPGIRSAIWKLVMALIVKGVLTVFTFGIKIPAGLFIPSMAVGAIFGRVVGVLLQQMAYNNPDAYPFNTYCTATEQCITPGFYAMVGAAAVLAGVTRMTVSLVVIMFELTGGLLYIVPLMIATMTAKWVGDSMCKHGIYDEHIRLNGYPFLDNKQESTSQQNPFAGDIMKPRPSDPPLQVLTLDGMTFEQVQNVVQSTTFNGFPLILDRETYRLCGYVLRRDLLLALRNAQEINPNVVCQSKVYFKSEIPYDETQNNMGGPSALKLHRIVEWSPFQITTSMDTVLDVFIKLGLRTLLVTNNGRLLGVITKKDVLRHMAEVTNQDPSDFLFH